MAGLVHSIEELVGRTPLMELDRFERQQQCGAHLLAKLEFFNPTGSVKDRAVLSMLNAAEEAGLLKPGGTIVEQTSGNTGIGLAAFAAERGYKLDIFLERGASLERRLMLLAYGARLLDYKDATGERPETKRTHPWQEPEREATLDEIAAYCRRTGAYFNNQAANPANPEAHLPHHWAGDLAGYRRPCGYSGLHGRHRRHGFWHSKLSAQPQPESASGSGAAPSGLPPDPGAPGCADHRWRFAGV